MKRNVLSIVFVMLIGVSFAQAPLVVGQKQFNVGVGLSGSGIPLYVGLDYGVHPDITVGGEISFRSYNESIATIKYHHSVIGVAGNGNYHFNTLLEIPENFDFYLGLNIGFYMWSSPNNYPGDHTSGLGLGAQLGGRYYFNEKMGLNLEFGGGNAFSGGKFGLSIKL